MHNSETDFFGKQEGERILCVVRPHPLARIVALTKIYLATFAIFIVMAVLGTQLLLLNSFLIIGFIMAILIGIIGTKIVTDYQKRDVAYITDRRLMRFEPTTFFATNSRALIWDEVVKVKTRPPNFIWKQLMIGNIIVHARSTIHIDDGGPNVATVDDIELKDVYYYKDLGNYIDKILFTYKQKPKEMETIRPFIAKPRGERY